jgi:hypothetical protein
MNLDEVAVADLVLAARDFRDTHAKWKAAKQRARELRAELEAIDHDELSEAVQQSASRLQKAAKAVP